MSVAYAKPVGGLLLGWVGWWGGPAPTQPPGPLGLREPAATRLYHRTQAGPRRWRGTVGPRAVTLWLDTLNWGWYSYDRWGAEIRLGEQGYREHTPIRLQERDLATSKVTSQWRLTTSTRPTRLTGTWQSQTSRRTAPIALRETYTDATRYELETWTLKRGVPVDSLFPAEVDSVSAVYTCLRVHLPRNPAAEQRLQRALGPPVDRTRTFEYLDTLTADYGRYDRIEVWPLVTCNTNYLLSFEQLTDQVVGDKHEWVDGRTFDLRTGRELQLADLLRPGYQVPLRRLLRQAMLSRHRLYPRYPEVGIDGQLPTGGFFLTPSGIGFEYDDRDDDSLAFPAPYKADRTIGTELSYAELLPLIRPDGPLAAMLRERGLTAAAAPAQVPARSAGK